MRATFVRLTIRTLHRYNSANRSLLNHRPIHKTHTHTHTHACACMACTVEDILAPARGAGNGKIIKTAIVRYIRDRYHQGQPDFTGHLWRGGTFSSCCSAVRRVYSIMIDVRLQLITTTYNKYVIDYVSINNKT